MMTIQMIGGVSEVEGGMSVTWKELYEKQYEKLSVEKLS